MAKNKNRSKRNMDFFELAQYLKKRKEKAKREQEEIESGSRRPREITPAQATQRMKFSMLGKFMGKIKSALDVGMTDKFTGSIAKAVRVNLSMAMIGDYPDVSIFYESIKISLGRVETIFYPTIRLFTKGSTELSWKNDEDSGCDKGNIGDDAVYLLIFNASREAVLYSDFIGKRADCQATVQLPGFNSFDELHCWVFLRSHNEKHTSESEYLIGVEITD